MKTSVVCKYNNPYVNAHTHILKRRVSVSIFFFFYVELSVPKEEKRPELLAWKPGFYSQCFSINVSGFGFLASEVL